MKLLQKKMRQWLSAIRTRSLPSGELILGMIRTIMKTIEYPFYATTFSQEEINRLVKPIHNVVLPRCELCRKILLALQYGLKNSLSLRLYNIFIIQGIEKVVLWIEEYVSNSLTGPFLRANYEAALIHLGIGGKQLFNLEYEIFGSLLPQL